MDDLAKESSEDVIAAATAHAETIEKSRADHLTALLNSPELAITLEDAVVRALGRGASENRYIDIGRIPFICDDIAAIKTTLEKMNDKMEGYPIVKLLVFGATAIILTGVVGEILFKIGIGH